MLRPIITASLLALLLASPSLGQTPAAAPAAPTELEQSGLTPPTLTSKGYTSGGEDVLVTQLIGNVCKTVELLALHGHGKHDGVHHLSELHGGGGFEQCPAINHHDVRVRHSARQQLGDIGATKP